MAHIPPTSSAVSCDPRQMLKVTFLKGPSIVSSCEIPRHSTNTMAPVPSAPVNVTIALFYRDFSISRLCACLSASVCLLYFAVLFFCLLDIFSVIVSVSCVLPTRRKNQTAVCHDLHARKGGRGAGENGAYLQPVGFYVKPQPKANPTNIANKTSPQGTIIRPSARFGTTGSAGVGGSGLALAILVGLGRVGLGLWFDHAVSWGRGVWVSVSDIGRVGSGPGLWFDVKTHGL